MSNELVSADPAYRKLVASTEQQRLQVVHRFPGYPNAATGFAATYIIVHYDGGVGASTLAAMTIPLVDNPMLIEIGGNRARVLKSVDAADRLRFSGADGESFGEAIDARIQCASRPAIIDCEQEAFREAIEAAAVLREAPFHSHTPLLIVAAHVDRKLNLVELAERFGIHDPIVFDQHRLGRARNESVIKIPTLPKPLQEEVYVNGKSLTEAIRSHPALFTVRKFAAEYADFAQRFHDRIAL